MQLVSSFLILFSIVIAVVSSVVFNTTNLIQNLTYIRWYNFDTVLYQLLETGTPDRNLIYLNQLLRLSGFSLNPLSFLLYSPFQLENIFHIIHQIKVLKLESWIGNFLLSSKTIIILFKKGVSAADFTKYIPRHLWSIRHFFKSVQFILI